MLRRSALSWLALLPLLVLDLFPFAVMLSTALKPPPGGVPADGRSGPLGSAWTTFQDLWTTAGFGSALLNSLDVALLSAILSMLVSVPAAYALSRYRFGLGRTFGEFLLLTQMLSPLVLVLGLFQAVAWLGLVDSRFALAVIYACFQIAFAVWMLRGSFDAIPKEIEEAAWLDGASRLRALWSIFLPMSLPAIAVTTIFSFIAAWNEFALAMTLLRSQDHHTLSVQIYGLVAGRYDIQWRGVMTAIMFASLPVAAIFVMLHLRLVRGLGAGIAAR